MKILFIVSFVCFLVCIITPRINRIETQERSGTNTMQGTPVSNPGQNESNSTSQPIDESMGDSATEPTEITQNNQTTQVEPITSSLYTVDSVMLNFEESPSVDIEKRFGEICEPAQSVDYEFVPKTSGTHRFEFSNVPNGTDLSLAVYNSGWEMIESYSYLDNGCGLSISLSANTEYFIRVSYCMGYGNYSVYICLKYD